MDGKKTQVVSKMSPDQWSNSEGTYVRPPSGRKGSLRGSTAGILNHSAERGHMKIEWEGKAEGLSSGAGASRGSAEGGAEVGA